MSFRYRLIDETGEDLGPLASDRSTWRPGETLGRWHGERLTVLRVVPTEQGELFAAYLVVRRDADRQHAQDVSGSRRAAPKA